LPIVDQNYRTTEKRRRMINPKKLHDSIQPIKIIISSIGKEGHLHFEILSERFIGSSSVCVHRKKLKNNRYLWEKIKTIINILFRNGF